MTRDQKKYTNEERFENPKFTGFFQGQANSNTGRIAGYCYYNAHTKVAIERRNPPANQNLENESGLFNHRIQDYDQLPSPTP